MSFQKILTTHAGSLPRTKTITAWHMARGAQRQIDRDEFEKQAAEAETAVIAKQLESGVDIINDGEVSRESFLTYVRHRMTGFGGHAERPLPKDLTMYPTFLEYFLKSIGASANGVTASLAAVGDITYVAPEAVAADCARLKRLLKPHQGQYHDAFITAVSPGIVATAMANQHYPDMATYVAALGRALRTEYKAISDAGFILQIDSPDLAMERHMLFQDKPMGDFVDFVKVVVSTINTALEGIPRERVRLHVCWGNYRAPHECDVALADIWPEIAKVNVGAYLLSLANPRHAHEVALFREGILPRNAKLVAGTIDTTNTFVEHPEVVAQRIAQSVEAVGDPERVIAGTDCGFETFSGHVMIAEEVVWAKLRALRDGAKLASQRLLGGA